MTVEEDDVDNGARFLWNLEEAVNAKVASDDTIAATKADVITLTMMRDTMMWWRELIPILCRDGRVL